MRQFELKPKMPNRKELDALARQWWDFCEPHCFHKWSDALLDLTYPLKMVPLPQRMIRDFFMLTERGHKPKDVARVRAEFAGMIDEALAETGWHGRFFAKLCTRSPKDYLTDDVMPRPLFDGDDLFEAMMSSMRCFDDLCQLVRLDVAYIVIRPYIDIEPHQEWRVFIKDGGIAGISQYHYEADVHLIPAINKIRDVQIREFVTGSVIPNFPLKDFVADLVVTGYGITLLEINPYGTSDPCLFGSYDNLDGTMKFLA